MTCIVVMILMMVPCVSNAETIDVQIKGIDDGLRSTKQQDYKEAVLFAKREAIERAGVEIKAMTTVKDLVLNSDYIESKAEAVLLPGYNVLDMGYSADGIYQIVLIGKVKLVSESIDSKELRYAKSLMDRGDISKARKIVADIIKNSKDDNSIGEAMYYKVVWQFTDNDRDAFERLKAYYPESQYVSRLERILIEREAEREKSIGLFGLDVTRTVGKITGWDERFVVGDRGFVLDTKTSLHWLVGPDRGTSWVEAKRWVKGLTIDGGGWRMPVGNELQSLYKKGAGERNMTPLLKTTGWQVWSAETKTMKWGDTYAELLSLETGRVSCCIEINSSKLKYRGFAVRSRRP
jgi:hypothetical protein